MNRQFDLPLLPQAHQVPATELRVHSRPRKAIAAEPFYDRKTNLLAKPIADHEKDAFMLRALLWEVQNTAI